MPAVLEKNALWQKEVGQVMRKNCATIHAEATVSQAIQKMKENRVSSLLVEPKSPMDDYAIITRRDIVERFSKEEQGWPDTSDRKVHEFAQKPLLTASSKDTVKEAFQRMQQNQLRRLPVTDGRRIVGILADSDIFEQLS